MFSLRKRIFSIFHLIVLTTRGPAIEYFTMLTGLTFPIEHRFLKLDLNTNFNKLSSAHLVFVFKNTLPPRASAEIINGTFVMI